MFTFSMKKRILPARPRYLWAVLLALITGNVNAAATGKYGGANDKVLIQQNTIGRLICITRRPDRPEWGFHLLGLDLVTQCDRLTSRCAGNIKYTGHGFQGATDLVGASNKLQEVAIINGNPGKLNPPITPASVTPGSNGNDAQIGGIMNALEGTSNDIGSGYNLDLTPGSHTVTLHASISNDNLTTVTKLASCTVATAR
ncbi:hypothetical protein ATT74_22150 [Salmonella enterica subsp. enterica serovar Panama]|uniref:Uncharacterized protein n=1 Tax=Salmonella enterica subsp. enterica serovar Panama TaxID=29472 RepID=A0A619AJL1_SALET|nr:hypothetical protein [Salmonella enterica subsp. enterica serovar Panama]EGU5383800.1 hypothetical protein [Salmonella enterica]ECX3497856.1 hypothetical protein [Salmonella enterica subsp. enterica serovar Panama]ECX6035219.1 hypothetical protein [Salmonella enterica subsp. enterica serovar Panama]EGX1720116.1 hypothetical protein [Salmonella enterica subsp. enterica serovar Panama]